jgi:hypothetical protein
MADDTGRAQPGLKQDSPQLTLPDVYAGKPAPPPADYSADISPSLRSAYKSMVENGVSPWNAREALLPPPDQVVRSPSTFTQGQDLGFYGQRGLPSVPRQTGDPVIGGPPQFAPSMGNYATPPYMLPHPGFQRAADQQPELEDQRFWGANLQRNRAFLNPGATAPYNTALPPQQEAQFRAWLTENKVPFNPGLPVSDYDMRGYWSALQAGDPHAKQEVDPSDNRPHFPDYWKTPLSATFSNESQWANPEVAPRWENDNLQLPNGQVLWDDKAQKWIGPNPPWSGQQPQQQPQAPLPRMGGVPTANSLLQQIGDVHQIRPEIPPLPTVKPFEPDWRGEPWNMEYQNPARRSMQLPTGVMPMRPANEAQLQAAPLLQQAALLRMLLPGGMVGPGGYKPMPGTQDNPLLQEGEEGAVVGSRPVPGSRDRNRFFNPNRPAPYNAPGVPDDRSQET